jgi:hypothetical protein
MVENTTAVEEIEYPTQADADGTYYLNADEAERKVKTDKDGNKLLTTGSGLAVVCRPLMAKDTVRVSNMMGGKKDLYFPAIVSIGTTINGAMWPMEDILNKMSMKDYNEIFAVHMSLNL